MQQRVMSFVKDKKTNCDESGSCYGYTDPCGQECFKHLSSRSTVGPRNSSSLQTTTGSFYGHSDSVFSGDQSGHAHVHDRPVSPKFRTSRAASREPLEIPEEDDEHSHDHHSAYSDDDEDQGQCSSMEEGDDIEAQQHHHHVPKNAFLSIGLQTSIAIALHKFPEGFITYATNHANPELGFNVFMALFVHNITEGFAMCLPLYMAIGSRIRAIAWSALLGGLSQPVGAGIAVLWFRIAKHTNMAPNETAYGCLFAATSGIMVSVALQLFVEALSLNHNRNLCIFFAFIGMALLSISNAFFAGH
jgi:ZIP family zinc transporter